MCFIWSKKLRYPDCFYYVDKQECSQYSRIPKGIFNVSRLVHNLPAWKKSSLSTHLKPKALVIADWTAEKWSFRKCEEVKMKLEQLMAHGFQLYLWQDGQVKALDKENRHQLDRLDIRNKMKPTYPDTIKKAAVNQQSLIYDQVFVLDNYWVNLLLEEKKEPLPRELSIIDLLDSSYSFSEIETSFLQATPPLTAINMDEYPIPAKFFQLMSAFKQPIFKICKKMVIDYGFSLSQYSAEGLDQVEWLQVFDPNPENPLYLDFLQKIPQIKRLSISNGFILFNESLNTVNFEHLEELNLTSSQIWFDELHVFLKKTTNLKVLDINTLNICTFLQIYPKEPLNLQHLQYIKIKNSTLSASYFLGMIGQATHLKRMDIVGCPDLLQAISQSPHLKTLEEFTFKSAKIDPNELQTLLAKTNNLRWLNLRQEEVIKERDIPTENLNFSGYYDTRKLEELDLSGRNYSLAFLQSFFIRPNRIRVLKLEACNRDKLDKDRFNQELHLETLEELQLIKTSICVENLHLILSKARHLKSLSLLNLYGCDNAASLLSSDKVTFQNLEILRLNVVFGENALQNIPHKMPKLTVLDISYSDISLQDVEILLEAAPHLKTLILSESQINERMKTLIAHIQNVQIQGARTKVWEQETQPEALPTDDSFSEDEDEKDDPLHYPVSTPDTKEKPREQGFFAAPPPPQTLKIDAPLSNKDINLTFNVKRHFYSLNPEKYPHPDIGSYRLGVFDTLEINKNPCKAEEAFILTRSTETDFIPRGVTESKDIWTKGKKLANASNDYAYYMCRQDFALTPNWQPIASLSALDEIRHFQLCERKAKVEIHYSEQDNLYYIRSKKPGIKKVSVDFLVSLNLKKQEIALPEDIQFLVNFFLSFESINPKPLDLSFYPNPTGADYLACIISQKTGACRHRALAFKELMKQQSPHIPTRVITNAFHAYVEIYLEGLWISINLGGYPVGLVEEKDNKAIAEENTSGYSHASADETVYRKALKTWNKNQDRFDSVLTYCQHLCQDSPKKKRLVEWSSNEDIKAMILSMQDYCQKTSMPCFYVASPEDLICTAPYIKHQQGSEKGLLTEGPSGLLYDFLQAHAGSRLPPVFIVNYANFEADDIVRFNTLLDKQRKVDGLDLPDDLVLLGFINPLKPNCYQGDDFYSRFDQIDSQSLDSQALKQHEEKIAPNPALAITSHPLRINLYHSLNWEEKLLGLWVIEQDHFRFQEGELAAALAKAQETGQPLEIQNGLWNDGKFQLFWQQARINGFIPYAGRNLPFPKDLLLLMSDGYDWDALSQALSLTPLCPPDAHILNPATLSDYFARYEYKEETFTLNPIPGLIEAYAGKELPVCLSRALSEDEWASLLDACQQHRVILRLYSPPGVSLPAALFSEAPSIPLVWQDASQTAVLISTDPDTTLSMLIQDDPSWLVLDISECESQDLLIRMDNQMKLEQGELLFYQSEKALLQALNAGQSVILKGRFSKSLVDDLAPFLFKRLQHPKEALGRLILLTEQADDLPFAPSQYHEVNSSVKQVCLSKDYKTEEIAMLSPAHLEKESLSQLQARLNYQRRHVQLVDTDKAWEGLYHLPHTVSLHSFDPNVSKEKADAFNQQRLNAVNAVFEQSPYVFLTGLTGVGKSTFVEKILTTSGNVTLYQGETQMAAWALDKSDKRKVLFIDEANLSTRQWSEFEGLFNTPPGILIDGMYHELSPNHKVIFAGNPLQYGDERTVAPFFARHGNTVVFDPLPMDYIYEYILKPIFDDSGFEQATIEEICTPILQVYAFLCSCSKDRILISPREVQMMALLTRSICQKHGHLDAAIFAANHYAYQLGLDLVPADHQKAFNDHFKPQKTWQRASFTQEKTAFLITPSREAISWQMVDLILLRNFKRQQATNDMQKYGGLGGMIIEGAPGIGKSELATTILLACGYTEIPCFPLATQADKSIPDKGFYRIPVSMDAEDKRKLLLKAFQGGSVVLIDEINSSPMMERLLNDLLMGKTPEGKPPLKPGFMIIGTQNPVTMAGRRLPSTALKRRLMTVVLPDYPQEEINKLLTHKGLKPRQADVMGHVFLSNREKAVRENKTPMPTIRDLLKLADQVLTGQVLAHKKELSFESLKRALVNRLVEHQHCKELNRHQFWAQEALFKENTAHLKASLECAEDLQDLILGLKHYFSMPRSDVLDYLFLKEIIKSEKAPLFGFDNIDLHQLKIPQVCMALINKILELEIGDIRPLF